jgi:hypothetical protein
VKKIVGIGSSKNNPLTCSDSEWLYVCCNMFAFFVFMTYDFFGNSCELWCNCKAACNFVIFYVIRILIYLNCNESYVIYVLYSNYMM